MRDHRLNYVAVGAFVLAMAAALIGVVSVMKGRTGATDPYYLVLDNVADVKYGTQVRYEGYPIGQVERIAPFAEGSLMRFRVDVGVRRGWRLPTDSLARVGSSSLLSAKTIDIRRGHSAATLKAGDAIPSAPPVDIFSVVTKVAGEFGDLSRGSLRPLLTDVGNLVRRFGGELETETMRLLQSLNRISGEIEGRAGAIATRLDSFSRRLDESGRHLREILSPQNAATVRQTLNDIHKTSRGFATTGQELNATLGQVNSLIGSVDRMVASNRGNVDRTLTDLRFALGTIAQRIDGIMHNIDGSSRNLNEFSRLIRQNPGLLLGGSPREQISPAGGLRN